MNDNVTITAGTIRATVHGLIDYLARIQEHMTPGDNPRPNDNEQTSHAKPASKPNINIEAHDLARLITVTGHATQRLARIQLRILDGGGWETPEDADPLKPILVYADAIGDRHPTTLVRMHHGLDTCHYRAERYLGITDPPIPLDRPCPVCGQQVMRAAHETLAWCVDRDNHPQGQPGRWDALSWVTA